MKMQEALEIIGKNKPSGFMVSFEKIEGGVLKSDYFPDKHAGEPLIDSEIEAWDLAYYFGEATSDDYVNIYVIDNTFSPVKGYSDKMIKKYKR